ncbi:hypothetical protein PMAYCL1PPCAC_02111, partial [Pristionchus mayeri]
YNRINMKMGLPMYLHTAILSFRLSPHSSSVSISTSVHIPIRFIRYLLGVLLYFFISFLLNIIGRRSVSLGVNATLISIDSVTLLCFSPHIPISTSDFMLDLLFNCFAICSILSAYVNLGSSFPSIHEMVYIPNYMPLTDFSGCFGARQLVKALIGNAMAVVLYFSCGLYLPVVGLAKHVEEEYKSIASVLSYVLFTLLMWTSFTFHYYIIGGGIKFASASSWELRATGFCMITAPKVHKMMNFFGLITSAISAYHCIVLDFLMGKFIPQSHVDHDVLFKGFLLKAHAVFCLLMASYCIFRVIYDPKIMSARKRFLRERCDQQRRQQPPMPSVSAEGWPAAPSGPQECSICTQRAANRQLKCGHIICCCCIAQLANTKACVTCPFCRMEVFNTRKLLVEAEKTTVPLMHCDGCGCKEDQNNCCEGRRNQEEVEHRRASVESHDDRRDGARALLLPMVDEMPTLGI